MKVAVIGATGYVGGRLVPELLAAGHDVRCLVRNPDRLAGVDWRSDVDVMTADVLDQSTLEEALVDIEAVYYLVHAMGHAGDFEQTDRVGAENTRVAAERAGVEPNVAGTGARGPSARSSSVGRRRTSSGRSQRTSTTAQS